LIIPVQFAARSPANFAKWTLQQLSTHHDLTQENQLLQKDLVLLKPQVQKLDALLEENNQLRAMLDLKKRLREKSVSAQILALDSNNLRQSFIIDQGKNDGASFGQLVVDFHGVMGQVIEVNNQSSRVLLISDEKSAIPVTNLRSHSNGILLGSGGGSLPQLAHVTATEDVKVGDVLVTSGITGKIPEGYPVGLVRKIIIVPGERFAHVLVQPAARLENSKLVFLIIYQPPKIEPIKNSNVEPSHSVGKKGEKKHG
jgi:rod shape-determining protein MreC